MDQKQAIKALEFSFFLSGIIAVLMIASQMPIGWVLALGATIVGTIWGYFSGNKWICLQNVIYSLVNIWGVYFNLIR